MNFWGLGWKYQWNKWQYRKERIMDHTDISWLTTMTTWYKTQDCTPIVTMIIMSVCVTLSLSSLLLSSWPGPSRVCDHGPGGELSQSYWSRRPNTNILSFSHYPLLHRGEYPPAPSSTYTYNIQHKAKVNQTGTLNSVLDSQVLLNIHLCVDQLDLDIRPL